MTTPDTSDRTITLPDGTALQVSEYGTGQPLVLVCGTTQSHRLWAPLLPALSARYRVITYDHRGIGDSARGDAPISMASLADDLNELLGVLGIDRTHVLGWSLGSTVAQELALRHPLRVAGLVLAGTWGRTDAFQACVFTGLGHPWRTGHRDVALTALGIAFSPELLNSPQYPAMMAQLTRCSRALPRNWRRRPNNGTPTSPTMRWTGWTKSPRPPSSSPPSTTCSPRPGRAGPSPTG
ncbi:MAG TPA: alpha/beta fold hydrolase, partial [Jatrophihabitans sp.]|nr:alpha/beta fold hydrolase [Jatrophihabitans sp.]